MDKLDSTKKSGFTTIELLMAFGILAMVLTAVVLTSFTNQSSLIDSSTNNEAIKIAQGMLEEAQARARKDFNLVNSKKEENGIYNTELFADMLRNPDGSIKDFLTKVVKARVTWEGERRRQMSAELVTLVSNFDSPAGANTCNSSLTFYDADTNTWKTEDWSEPEIEDEYHFSDIAPTGTYTISDLDAYKNRLYVTASKTSANSLSTFFIFDSSDTDDLDLMVDMDNASSVISGLNTVKVAEDLSSNPQRKYAYIASNTLTSYNPANPCNPADNNACGQLYIYDVTNDEITTKANVRLPINSVTSEQIQGSSLFYRNNYVFLGLTKNNGPEFHIIDVHNPSEITSSQVSPVGSFEVNSVVNSIWTRNGYAYVASPNDQELKILNISNPAAPTAVGGYSAGSSNGKSLALVGDVVYLGKADDISSDVSLAILDNISPSGELPLVGSININKSVNKTIVRDYLVFLLTNSELQIFHKDTLANIATLPLPNAATNQDTKPSMDCEGNRIFVSVNDTSGQGSIYVIKPGND